MRVTRDDVRVCLRPAIGEHVGSGGMRQERRVSGLESRGYGGMGVWGYGTIHRYHLQTVDRVGLSFVRGREFCKKK